MKCFHVCTKSTNNDEDCATTTSNQTTKSEQSKSLLLKKNILTESITPRITGRSGKSPYYTFPQGLQFSPDGTCILTSRENRLELYNTPYNEENEDNNTDEHEVNIRKQQQQQQQRDHKHNNDGENNKAIWKPELIYNTGETVRSYKWYPHMRSSEPATCCFVGVSRDSPVHLYDAYDGSIRATYRPYNRLDEMESPTTLCFVESGQKFVTGGLRSDRMLHIFDINRPGREHNPPILKLGKTRRSKDGQKGLVSAMAYSDDRGVIAVGTYSPGSIYLYDLRTYSKSPQAEVVMSSSTSTPFGGSALCVVGHGKRGKKIKITKRKRSIPVSLGENTNDYNYNNSNSSNSQSAAENSSETSSSINFSAAKRQWYSTRSRGGVTQIEFDDTSNSNYLFSTSRRANAILQWDLRKISSLNYCPGIASFETANDTNQRIEFQVVGDKIWTGGKDKSVRVYSHQRYSNTKEGGPLLVAKIDGFRDCVNGIALHRDSASENKQLLWPNVNDTDFDDNDNDDDKNYNYNKDVVNRIMEKSLLAVSIGTRHFPSMNDWETDDPHSELTQRTMRDGSVQVLPVIL